MILVSNDPAIFRLANALDKLLQKGASIVSRGAQFSGRVPVRLSR